MCSLHKAESELGDQKNKGAKLHGKLKLKTNVPDVEFMDITERHVGIHQKHNEKPNSLYFILSLFHIYKTVKSWILSVFYWFLFGLFYVSDTLNCNCASINQWKFKYFLFTFGLLSKGMHKSIKNQILCSLFLVYFTYIGQLNLEYFRFPIGFFLVYFRFLIHSAAIVPVLTNESPNIFCLSLVYYQKPCTNP